jgi:hypothetical protein
MIIYRQKMYGAFPASWGKDMIAKFKKGRRDIEDSYSRKLRGYRNQLKISDPLANRQKYIKDTNETIKSRERSGNPLNKDAIDQLRRTQMKDGMFKIDELTNVKARNATPINRKPQEWEKLADKSREDTKNWRVEQARRDQEAKYQAAQKRIAKLDQQAQSQQKSKGGFVSHVFGR